MKKITLSIFLTLAVISFSGCKNQHETQAEDRPQSSVQERQKKDTQTEKPVEKQEKIKAPENLVIENGYLRFTKPTVIISLDDGTASDYEINYPYFKRKGLCFTSFINASTVGKEGYVTIDQLREMAEAGFDIQDHHYEHLRLSELSAEEILTGLDQTDAFFKEIGLETPTVLAAPYGNLKGEVSSIIGDRRHILRATIWMKPLDMPVWYQTLNKEEARQIYTENIDIQDDTYDRMTEIMEEIDQAAENHALINLYFHRTFEENPESLYHSKASYIHQIVEYLEAKGFQFMTYKQLDEALQQVD